MKSKSFFAVLACVLNSLLSLQTTAAPFQEDSYHASIRTQLQSEYGITGGDWVIADNESDTMANFLTYGGVVREQRMESGQPFQQVLRVTSPTAMRLRYDRAAYIDSTTEVATGDTMLLVLWVRGIAAQADDGIVMAQFRRSAAPWEQSLNKLIAPSAEWQQWFIPFEMLDTFDVGGSSFVLQIASQQQTLEFGGIALLNFGTAYTVADLEPVRTRVDEDYRGRELDADWRTAADERIDQYRKGDLVVNVVDLNGNLIPDAMVSVEMTRHAYEFGSAINSQRVFEQDADAIRYRETILNLDGNGHGFNHGTTENQLQWLPWEASNTWAFNNLNWMQANGIDIKGHSVVWPRIGWPNPSDVLDNLDDPSYIDSRVRGHITDKLAHSNINGAIPTWDFVNEFAHHRPFAEQFALLPDYQTGDEIFGEWLALCHSLEPNADYFYNEYEIFSDGSHSVGFHDAHKDLVDLLQTESGNLLDGLGFQSHVNLPLPGPERVLEVLDGYASRFPDLRIHISEYDLDITNDQLSADYLRDFMTVVFSHPQTDAFIIWGFWDGEHWLDNAPLFYADWTPKPACQEYINLVFGDWWTQEQGTTDAQGKIELRGFFGDYQISATHQGESITESFRLDPTTSEITLTIPATVLVPESVVVSRGTTTNVDAASLAESDNLDLAISRSSTDIQGITEFEVEATSPTVTPTTLILELEGSVFARTPVDQTILMYDFGSEVWEAVDTRRARRFSDLAIEVQPDGDLSRFVENGTNRFLTRIRYKSVSNRQRFTSNTDVVRWLVQ